MFDYDSYQFAGHYIMYFLNFFHMVIAQLWNSNRSFELRNFCYFFSLEFTLEGIKKIKEKFDKKATKYL